ncbi:uncharacterized protein LOC108740920 [Agrilus planipennis]|uniref:Uncharacterized protein LOC108740920 n=1 Tax=Agrilus planipennis TaxID=224129 RepID=A0A1W4XF40_AGRPL|nr:uncharacterized protein LOC108740920 [Agrilus planipennis]
MIGVFSSIPAMRLQVLVTLMLSVYLCSSEEEDSANYLQNAIRDLSSATRKQNPVQVLIEQNKESHFEDNSNAENRVGVHENQIPPLSLTKGELMAIYEAAASNGGKILNSPPQFTQKPSKHSDEEEYYYYYIPLKSFVSSHVETSKGSTYSDGYNSESYYYPGTKTSTPNALYNYHTHNHQVNVKVEEIKSVSEKKKSLQPLFMAISGFIGMAAMIIISILCLPKFGKIKFRSELDDVSGMSRVALQVLDGEDCTERFKCEIGKAAYTFSLHNNRFTKLLKRLLPKYFGNQINKIGKYAQKKAKCSAIPCQKR